jgi:hypothetical protein
VLLRISTQRRRGAEAQKGERSWILSFLQSVDHAMDALSHQAFAEVDDQAQLEIAEPQIGEDLCLEQAIV